MDRGCQFAVLLLISVIYCVNCEKVRWCSISGEENQKCWDMSDALKGAGITPELECVMGANAADCMEKITAGTANLITLDGGDVYHAGSVYGMQPVMGEQYSYGKFYYAVAVVHKDNAGWSFSDLQGKKSCHTGVRKTSGWNVPIGYMINAGIIPVETCQSDIKAAGNFFSQSCAPGALNTDYNPDGDNPHNLCELCIGEQSNKCARNSDEPYYNYDGAFRCLFEGAGDVAFVKHTTVNDVITDNPSWANGLSESNYRLLCKGGTSEPIANYGTCNLAKVVGHGVMTSASASANDISMYQQLLTAAQNSFGDDNGAVFKMFDSSAYGKKDLMFKDSTVSLHNVDSGSSYEDYLGDDYVNTVKGLNKCVRWCTISDQEQTKCELMKQKFAGAKLSRTISCHQASNHGECMQLIKDGEADVVTLDGGDAYTAGKDYGLVPVAGEKYSDDLDDASYYAVAVVKKTSDFSISELKGKKSCHTGIGKTSGWNVPVGYLIEEGQITVNSDCDVPKQVGDFFSESCAPGAKSDKYNPSMSNVDSLCDLCKGTGDDHCIRGHAEPYYDYSGAFKCLADGAGDVAFVKHTTVGENTDNSDPASNYELLCRDGTRKATTDWLSCNLARVPAHVVMTNSDNIDRATLWSFLDEAQQIFGKSNTDFSMFSSSGGKDLLFKDSTQELVYADDKDTYQKWLGDEYLEAVEAINCVGVTGASGRAILSPVLIVVTLFVVLKSFLL